MTPRDPQLECYQRMSPQQYARAHDAIAIAMRIGERDCTGNGCDLGRPCPRHARSLEVAERYLRLRERTRCTGKQ